METLILQLVGVCALLVGLAVVWKLRQTGVLDAVRSRNGLRADSSIRLIARKSLTSQHALYLVDVSGRVLLVSTSPQSCQILETIRTADPRSQVAD